MPKKPPEFPTATPWLPEKKTLPTLREAAAGCEGCDLFERASQTVFGEGPSRAKVMLVGEQPGDREDKEGHPFVGPAGRLLDECLVEAGIDRRQVYVTNVVKHFKWSETVGKRRLHAKPNAREINACRPWLDSEIETVRPKVIVCLGATAAQALLGRAFRVTQQRGQFVPSPLAQYVTATIHPSAILRAPDDATRHEERQRFIEDLKKVAAVL